MKKFLLFILFIVLVIISALIFQGGEQVEDNAQISTLNEEKLIREPAVAGQFYESDANKLKVEVNKLLTEADSSQAKGEINGLILPHASHYFSGSVAAHGFKELIGKEIDTVILIGNSHKERFDGISVFQEGAYKTPLGEVEIDTELAQKIINADQRIVFKESVHQNEHSLEVQLPFLQEVLDDFKIVPILFGNNSSNDYQILAQAIINNIKGENILLIASSDLSHYPSYQNAQYADSKTINAILSGKVEELENTIQQLEQEKISNTDTLACGIDAIKTIMLVMEELGIKEIKVLNQANSGDISNDKTRVVGYVSIGFFEKESVLLNKAEQEKLLEIAKSSIESFVKTGEILEFQVEDEALNEKLGAFVTLTKDNELRGCIGSFSPASIPLYQTVSKMAIAAASQDKRFYPINKEELKDLDYEISVLSSLKKIGSWEDIELGKHGVQIRKGLKSGVFLPQVATDNNWDLDKFMGELCSQKAGLSWNCWKEEDIQIFVFTAQVFD